MKIKDSFVLSEIGGSFIVIPTGSDTVDLNGMITLNETGCFLWKILLEDTTKEALVDAVAGEYDADKSVIEHDVVDFLDKLRSIGALCE